MFLLETIKVFITLGNLSDKLKSPKVCVEVVLYTNKNDIKFIIPEIGFFPMGLWSIKKVNCYLQPITTKQSQETTITVSYFYS
jgi:hypothetical protein